MLRYAITDCGLFGGSLDAMLLRLVEIAPQLDYLQVRERGLSAAKLEAFVTRLISALAELPKRPLILVNHRADVALACRADGVHLRSGPGELTAAQIRELYRSAGLPPPVISVSCHTLEDLANAKSASLILFGPVFEKQLPADQPPLPGTGIELLAHACFLAAPAPVLALGGVTAGNQQECLAAGAAGIAGIRHFLVIPQSSRE
jgi:thiamine-phosphate pyrophosphorylase